MARLPLTIDGVDFSEAANQYGYDVEYVPRAGGQGGMLIGGDMQVDVLAYKARLTWDLNFLTGTQLAQVFQATLKPYVSVTFLDPALNAARTATMMPTVSGVSYAFSRSSRHYYHDGATLTMEEK